MENEVNFSSFIHAVYDSLVEEARQLSYTGLIIFGYLVENDQQFPNYGTTYTIDFVQDLK